MRVLFLTDIHNNITSIEKLPLGDIDILLIGGDFTLRGGKQEIEAIVKEFKKNFDGKILSIIGNMDKREGLEVLNKYSVSIECSGVQIGDIGFFGCGGSEKTPFDTPNEKDSNEIYDCLVNGYKSIEKAKIKVMICHNPPFGTTCDKAIDKHVGSKKVREFIEKYSPDFCLTGHIHEGIGQDLIGKTKLINPGPFKDNRFAVIDISKGIINLNML